MPAYLCVFRWVTRSKSFRNRWSAALEQRDWDTLQVLAINPEVKDQLVAMAEEWRQAGDWTGAVNLLKDANERHPGDFRVNFELAYVYGEAKPAATDEAIRYFTAALALRPNSSAAHNNRGAALHDKHKRGERSSKHRKP